LGEITTFSNHLIVKSSNFQIVYPQISSWGARPWSPHLDHLMF